MPAGLVNQLMACHWMEQGIELESQEMIEEKNASISERLKNIERRRKIKFDF